MEQFKCRASASGKLMTNPKVKTEMLSETTKTYLKEWLTSKIFGVEKQISSKYLTKGTLMEDTSIEMVTEWLNFPFIIKNEKQFSDDFFTGTPDLIYDEFIADIKTSWDCFTFPLFESEIPTKDYYYQLQVYMHLTGKRKAKLIYVLLNTPEFMTYEPTYDYSEIEPKYKIKIFEVNYDESVIETLKNRVVEARRYINTLYNAK